MTLLTTSAEVARFCQSLDGDPFVTVDTEFMRERTYWPKLCLVQLASSAQAVAIDPLAEGMDLSPLYALMADPRILKVFHAARQDVEIFYNATGQVPAPMFDTQVAAMVCGFGEAASYETLATKLANGKIDKSSRFTDWSHRPLTARQITYAIADVTYLRTVYEKLRAQLDKSGRSEWMQEEMATLTSPSTYRMDPREAWRRLKMRSDKPMLRALARELAAWREAEAQRLDIPRGRVLRDETLMEIAHHAPATKEDLARTRGLGSHILDGRGGEEILAAVARARALPPEECPLSDYPHAAIKPSAALLDLLRVLLKQVSDDEGVAAKLIATSDDLALLASADEPDIPALTGWRRQLFGEAALALKRGELALAVKGRKVVRLKA